jgi:subfamily B ATP-binding cassette protein MsbA
MIKSLKERIFRLSLKGQQTNANYLPQSLRTFLRSVGGGSEWEYQFLRGLLWRNRFFILISLCTNLSSVAFEVFSLTLIFLAIQIITSDASNLGNDVPIQIVTVLQKIPIFQSLAGLFFGLVVLAVIAQVLRSLFQFLGDVVFAFIIGHMENEVRTDLVEQYFSIDYPDISNYKIGDLAIYPSHVQNLGRILASTNRFVIESLLLIAYVGYLMWLSWQISLVGILFIVVVSLLLQRVRVKIKIASQRQLDAMVNYQELITEFLEGVRTIHVFDRKTYTHLRIRPVIDFTVLARRSAYIWVAVSKPLIEVVGVIGIAVFLFFGFRQYTLLGESVVPVLVTFLAVLYRLIPRAATLNNTAGQISRQWPFVTRLALFLQKEDKSYVFTAGNRFVAFDQTIEFQNVNFYYPETDKLALENFSLKIQKGESIAFVGPSGSGKSTIVNLLMGLYKVSSGELLVDGQRLTSLNLTDWKSQVGIVDQDTFVFNDTVSSNIRFGNLEASDDDVIEAAKIGNAHEFVAALPNGYNTQIGNRGQRLSGGQRQRLAIARAIVRNPSILIFDEATSALDSQSERLIQESVQSLRADRTILMVAHRLSTVTWADKIIVLQNGKIVEAGRHAELLKDGALYAKFWHAQEEKS